MVRHGLTAAFLLGSAVLLGACGSSSSTSTTTTSSTAPTPSTGATTSTTPPLITTSTTTGTPNCSGSQLTVTSTGGNGGAGHIGVVLLFTNSSTTTCLLSGYPGVAALDSSGHQAAQAVRTLGGYLGGLPSSATPPVVTLAAGQVASAVVEGSDVPVGSATSCPTYPGLLVTPPNTTRSTTIIGSLPGCAPIEVHPVVAGKTGSAN